MIVKATFYGVSVGPGDPEHLTRKAVRVLEHCPVIAAPMTGDSGTLALDIAGQAVDLTDKRILKLAFAMTRDAAVAEAHHRRAADAVLAQLVQGRDVAMLSLGDISVYSTFGYILPYIRARGFGVDIIPGVPSFCAAAARIGQGLTEMNGALVILPAACPEFRDYLRMRGTKIVMKAGRGMEALKASLRENGLLERAVMVENCGLSGERVVYDLASCEDAGYFTTVMLKEKT